MNNGFVIAGNLTPSKRAEFKSYKVVREEWILRSCEAGQLLDWRQFVLRPTVVQKHLSDVFDNGQWPGGSQAQPTLFDMRPKDTQPPSPAKSLQRRPKDNAQLDQNIPSYAPSKPTHVAAELLKDEEWRRKSTAIAPGFIDGYYKNSRLHHLSTWKAELPAMITNLTADLLAQGKHVPPQTAPVAAQRGKTLSGTASDGRCIMHVDFDCMFVSAGLLAQPELKGLPIAVCHATSKEQVQSSTSEIASCSYEARAFGVKNGMS